MNYVYDASFIGPLIIPDEKNPKVEKAYKEAGEKAEIFIPQLFWYEIANIIFNTIRRKRFTYEDAILFYKPLSAIRLTTDFETGINYSKKIFSLCNDYNLSSYDATYLELAERKKAILCTLDNNLIIVAKKYGVTVIKGI